MKNHRKIWSRVIAFLLVIAMFPVQTFAMAAPIEEPETVTVELLSELLAEQAAEETVETQPDTVITDTLEAPEITSNAPPAHVPVQDGDVRIQNNGLRMDVGRLGQITRLNIVDMDLGRFANAANQAARNWAEMNFVASEHTYSAQFNNSNAHQWIGEMIFSVRSAESRAGLANAGPFVEVDTNRTLQAGGRVTHTSPLGDPNTNPFFERTHDVDGNRVVVNFNPDPNNMPTGTEPNPAGGSLGAAAERERIITNFQVESVFDAGMEDNSVTWSITITNPTEEYIEFGDVGLPMLWNSRFSRAGSGAGWPGNNTEHVYDNAVVPHSFQGADSGYIKIMPPRGDNFLAFVPVPQTGARIEYVDHWTLDNWGVGNVHRGGAGSAWNIWRNDSGGPGTAQNNTNYNLIGVSVAYIHSANIRNFTGSSYFHDTLNGPTYDTCPERFPGRFNPVAPGTGFGGGANPTSPESTPLFTTLVLGPGESQTYEFEFHAIRGGDGTPEPERGGRNNRMDTQNLDINHMMEREMNFRSVLHDAGMIDAVALPGFQPAIDMPTLIALRHNQDLVSIRDVVIYCIHENDVFSDQHIPAWGSQAGRNRSRSLNARGGRGVCGHVDNQVRGTETEVIYRADLSGYQNGEWVAIYELIFTCIGHNSVRVYYDLLDEDNEVLRPAFTQFEFNVLTELDELAMAHAVFLRTHQQFSAENPMEFEGDPSTHRFYGMYFDWHLSHGMSRIATSPVHWGGVHIPTYDIFSVPAGAPPATAWGDDWSHGHALFMSMANYMSPTYENIRSLENFLLDFMWDRYMSNRHETFLMPNMMGDSILNGNQSATNDRFFSAAMVANTFFNMYRTMRAFPEFMEYRQDALFYLDVAAAMWDNGLRGGWASGAGIAFYGEQQVLDIIQALHQEGRYHRRDTLVEMYTTIRVQHDMVGTYWPFRSEFEYDNTTEEGLYTRIIAMLHHNPDHPALMDGEVNRGIRHMQVFNWATRSKRGFSPTWFQHGVPQFRAGESWWNFQYTTSLAAFIMDNWMRYQYDFHDWAIEDISWANRVNYAARMGNFNHVNMGQISDRYIGAVSNTYTMRKGTFGTQSVQIAATPVTHNGWHNMGMEAALSVYGSLLSISVDVLDDTIFGPVAYGGEVVSSSAANWTVQPRDGFGRQLNFLEERIYITSTNNRIEEARLTRDGSRLEMDLYNLMGMEHVAHFYVYGLNPGFYSITLDGAPAGQFYVPETGHDPRWGAGALQGNAYVKIPSGENFTVVFAEMADGETAAPTLGIVQQFSEPWVGESLPLLGQILHDGSTSIESIQWEVVNAPEDAEYSFEGSTPRFTNTAATLSRRNSTWVTVDTSITRGASFTPETPGEYTLRLTVVTAAGDTVYEYITFTVIVNPNILAPTVMDVAYDQASNMVTLTADVHNFDLDGTRAIEYTWEIISWPAGGENAAIIVPDDPTEVLAHGWTGGSFERTRAILALPRGGTFTVRLTATDLGMTTIHYFDISAHGDFDIRAYNVVTSAGVLPVLPETVRVPVGGTMEDVVIEWGTLNPAQFMVPDSQVDLTGAAVLGDGSAINITTTVFVVRDANVRYNYAPDASITASGTNSAAQVSANHLQRLDTPFGSSSQFSYAHGLWHNFGAGTYDAAWLRYTWTEPRLMDRMDIFVVQEGTGINTGNFNPRMNYLQVRLPSGEWVEPRNIEGFTSTRDVWNVTTFEPQYITGLHINIGPGGGRPDGGGVAAGLFRWWPFGYDREPQEGGDDLPIEQLPVIDRDALRDLREIALQYDSNRSWLGLQAPFTLNTAGTLGAAAATARFTNWAESGVVAAREAALVVINDAGATQEEIEEAYADLVAAILTLQSVPVHWREAPMDTAFAAEQRAGNIAFQGGRTASHVTGDTRIWQINNNSGIEWRTNNLGGASAWGTWSTGGVTHPERGGPTGTGAGSWNWLEYSWPMGARIDSTIVYHWRDGGGINRPTGLSVMYLPLYTDVWREAHFVTEAELNTNTIANNRVGVTNITFDQPLEARAVRVWFQRLANGSAPGVAEWQVFGSLTTMQEAPGSFAVTHNTVPGGEEGVIANVYYGMEWRFGPSGEWTAVLDGQTALTNLANGNFYIRYAGFGTVAPSPAVRVGVRLQRTEAPTGLGSEPATEGLADGIITGVAPTMEFTNNYPDGPWQRVTGITIPNVQAGTWYVRYAETNVSSDSPAATVVVEVWEANIVPHDPPSGLIPNPPGRPGDSDGSILGVTSAMQWRPAGEYTGAEEGWRAITGTRIPNLAAGSFEVRYAATPRNSASAPVTVIVPDGEKGGQAAPSGLVGVSTSILGGNNGQITGASTAMEWARSADATEWTRVTGTAITGLESGYFYVRRAETDLLNPSPATRVFVPDGVETCSISLSITDTHTFPTALQGYDAQTPVSVTVTNTGTLPTGALTVALSGPNADAFTLSAASLESVAVDGYATFTVVPNVGLTVGTYTATVTVDGADIVAAQTFALSFTVTRAATGGGTLPGPIPEYVYHDAYMFGNTAGEFRPRANTTRAEVAAILVRTMVEDFEHGEYPEDLTSFAVFSDVTSENWFYWYIVWAYAEGLVQGFDNGTFRPNAPITRQEYAAMVVRTGEVLEVDDLDFDDAEAISNWALDYVYTAFSNGWMVGDDNNNFRPSANIVRAEVATATNRILGRVDSNAALAAANLQNPTYVREFPDVANTAWYFASVLGAANDHRNRFENEELVRKYILVEAD